MFRRRLALLGACLWMAPFFGAVAHAGELGPPLGEAAPRFELVDQSGLARSFDSLLERGKLAIVFFRSADW